MRPADTGSCRRWSRRCASHVHNIFRSLPGGSFPSPTKSLANTTRPASERWPVQTPESISAMPIARAGERSHPREPGLHLVGPGRRVADRHERPHLDVARDARRVVADRFDLRTVGLQHGALGEPLLDAHSVACGDSADLILRALDDEVELFGRFRGGVFAEGFRKARAFLRPERGDGTVISASAVRTLDAHTILCRIAIRILPERASRVRSSLRRSPWPAALQACAGARARGRGSTTASGSCRGRHQHALRSADGADRLQLAFADSVVDRSPRHVKQCRSLIDGDASPKVLFEHPVNLPVACRDVVVELGDRLTAVPFANRVPDLPGRGAIRLSHCDI